MGVGYLSRIARRGLPAAAPAGKVPGMPAKPAIASRSPIAEADQRMHLEGFADAFVTVPVESADADTVETSMPASSPPWPDAPTAVEGRSQSVREDGSATSQAGGYLVGDTRPAAILPPGTESGAYPDIVEKDETIIVPADSQSAPPDLPPRQRGRLTSRKRSTVETPPPTRDSASRPGRAVPTDEVTKQFATLERWLEVDRESQSPHAGVQQATEVKPVTDRAPAERPVYAPQANSAATIDAEPRLEIGSIEVEVISPPKASARREPRTPRRPERAPTHSFRTTPFGWRQR